jgi:diguanylate cyclase (GGDEF)-like protein/PAS domain S-box-containing protein
MRYNIFMSFFDRFSKMAVLDTFQNPVIFHDLQGRIQHVNQPMLELFGLPDQKCARELNLIDTFSVDPKEAANFRKQLSRLVKSGKLQFEWRCRGKFGNRMTMVVSVASFERSFCTQLWEITANKKIEEELRVSEAKFRLMTENSADVIWHLDQNFRFTFVSNSDEMLRGFKAHEIIGKTIFSQLRPEGVEYVKEMNRRRLENEKKGIKTGVIRYELEQICKDGNFVWTESNVNPFRDPAGNLTGYDGVTRDISQRKQAELQLHLEKMKLEQTLEQLRDAQAELTYLADFDSLTRLMNRRSFQRVTEKEIERSLRYHHHLVLVMLDVDNFKNVNDKYGHPMGDEVLTRLGTILSDSIRQQDEVARMGGEEFALLLTETDSQASLVMTERIRNRIEHEILPLSNQTEVSITCSFGLAELNPSKPNFVDFYRTADEALYKAKQMGKNRIEVGEFIQ